MRIALVGAAYERARLRAALREPGVSIVGEFQSLDELRRSEIETDGILLTSPRPRLEDDEFAGHERLSPRELEVLELLAEGMPNKAIARRLQISDQTVKFHVTSIRGKLGASNRTDAVRRALRRGLITV